MSSQFGKIKSKKGGFFISCNYFAINFDCICKQLEKAFENCCDFSVRYFEDAGGRRYACAYIDNLSDRGYISSSVILPIAGKSGELPIPSRTVNADLCECRDFNSAVSGILDGNALIFTEGEAYIASVRSEEFRGIENAGVEEVVRGPHDSFIEDAATNVSLVRRRIKSTALKCECLRIGNTSQTKIYTVWLEGRADSETVSEVINRIKACKLETVHDSGTLEMAILDGKFSIFPMLGNTERPDKAAAKISEGRVAIFADGSPVVLTAPNLYIETLQSSDDYSKSPQYATFARVIRFVAVLMSLCLPAVYLAILEYSQVLLSKRLLITLAAQRESVPYGIFAEIFIMLTVFDIIREVGQRMPRAMGSVVSIVAGIVLGDAAMNAGLVSSPTLMVIALSATCAYISPPVTWTNILLKYVFVVLAQLGGLLGVGFCFAICTVFLCSKTSFGVPYFQPVAPFVAQGIKDTVIKLKSGVQNE